MVVTAVIFLAAGGARAGEASAEDVVRGTAFYRERIALRPGAVLEVTLEDVSRMDVPAEVIGSARIENPGNPPFRFEIPYDPDVIDQRHTYSVRARITAGDALLYTTDQVYPVLTRGAGNEVELLLRGVARSSRPTGPLGALPATFAGVLPCADCEGIRYHLDLHADDVFFLRRTWLGRGDEATDDDIGVWHVIADGSKLVLWGGAEEQEMFRIVDTATLRKLDLEGNDIESSLDYDLRRSDGFAPIEPRLAMRGMYQYMADAGLLEECLTGRRMPVAQEGDNAALERAYLEAKRRDLDQLLVSFEGRIALRPLAEGGGLRPAVVVDRFEGVWPGETCGARGVVAELEDSYWKLTRLGETPVVVSDQQREPHLMMRSEDGRVAGFTGCNRVTGAYEVEGRSIAFSQTAVTMRACIDGMEYEADFKRALEDARSWRITGEHLELFDRNGNTVARLEARAMP